MLDVATESFAQYWRNVGGSESDHKTVKLGSGDAKPKGENDSTYMVQCLIEVILPTS